MPDQQPSRRSAARTSRRAPDRIVFPQFPPIPAVPNPFMGRDRPLTRALDRLERQSVVGITGAAGSGKSALAAVIAQRRAQPIIWVTLSEGATDPVDELLWQLVQPLSQANPQLLATQDRMRQANYAPLVRLQVILAAYAEQPDDVLICIDQVEQALGAVLRSLLVGMCDFVALTADTRITLMIVGRTLPYRLRSYMLPPLNGLAEADVEQWAAALNISLSPAEIADITRQTGGLPLALHALGTAIRETADAIPFDQIMAVREIRQQVISILGTLPVEEQRTIAELAAHPERFATLSAEVLPQIEALEQRHLVAITPDAVQLHPFLLSYYRQLLG